MSQSTTKMPRRRLVRAVSSLAFGLVMTVGGLYGASASADEVCDDIVMPCTTY